MNPIDIALKLALLPVGVSFAIAGGLTVFLRNKPQTRPEFWVAPLAICCGMFVGQIAYDGFHWPKSIRVVEGWQWLQAFAVVALLVLPFGLIPKPRSWLVEILRFAAFAGFAAMAILALPSLPRSTAYLWIAGATIVGATWATALSRLAAPIAGKLWPGMLALVVVAAAVTMALQSSARIGFLTAALAASLGGILLAQLVSIRRPSLSANAGRTYAPLLLVGMLIVHRHYSLDVPEYTLPVLLLAPFGTLIGRLPWLRRQHTAINIAAQIIAVVAIAALVVVPSAMAYETDPYADYR